MIKTIKQIKATKHFHPAVGRAFSIIFSDGTQDLVYEETFYHQIPSYIPSKETFLIDKKLDTNERYFKVEF